MPPAQSWKDRARPALPIVLGIAAFVIIIAAAKASASLLNPFLLSVFIAVLCGPPVFTLTRHGIPKTLSITIVVTLFMLLFAGLGLLLGRSAQSFIETLPEYRQRLEQFGQRMQDFATNYGVPLPEGMFSGLLDTTEMFNLFANALSGFTSVLTNSMLIVLTVLFLLYEASSIPAKLTAAFGNDASRPGRGVARFLDTVNRYIAMKTLVSLATGVIISLGLYLIGVDYYLLWGVVAFLLNFIPNIGSILAAIPAVLLATLDLGLIQALETILLYAATNLIFGNLVEPRLLGRTLGLSTLVVFLSMVFWGWVLGPVGMLLSVPLTVTLKIALESRPDTRWIAILLGSAQEVEQMSDALVSHEHKKITDT